MITILLSFFIVLSKKLNNDSLKISESFDVSIGGVGYGQLKALIVQNDKMEFTIEIKMEGTLSTLFV